jgi:hypothetical protein
MWQQGRVFRPLFATLTRFAPALGSRRATSGFQSTTFTSVG